MNEPQKMEALKKAYAEIILNTAKEAAAKIMVAERKAVRFQQELFVAKEEAVSMMVRMKQLMDYKLADMENTVLHQKSKIDELEAQLHEAEDLVTDLRAELKQEQYELEKMRRMKSDQVRPLDALIVKGASSHEDASLVNKISASGLYRNGCTQRVRAFERSVLDGKMPSTAHTGIRSSSIRNKLTVREDEKAEVTCTLASPRDVNMRLEEKKRTGLEILFQQLSSCGKGQAVTFSSKRRRSRKRKPKFTSYNAQVIQGHDTSTLSRCTAHPLAGHSNVEAGENTDEEECQENSRSNLASLLTLGKVDTDPQPMDDTASETEFTKEASVLNAVDTALPDKLHLMRHDNEIVDRSGFSICKPNPKAVDVSLTNSDSELKETCKPSSSTPTRAVNDRLLKYTFQRKRKREPLSCPNDNASQEMNSAQTKSAEKQVQPQKSNFTMEPSRDSRRVMVVARQLMSMSEKKCWQ